MSNAAFQIVGEVETDTRRRVSLASLRTKIEPNARYRVEAGPHGELRLLPVFSFSMGELMAAHPDLAREIEERMHGDYDALDPDALLAELDQLEQ